MATLGTFTAGQVLTAAELNAIGTWTTYTPAWTAASTNPVLGNGSISGQYTQINDLVVVLIRLVTGSTTTYGSGRYDFSLPVNYSNLTAFGEALGSATLFDASLAQVHLGVSVAGPSASTITVRIAAGGFGDINSGAPFTFANGDTIAIIATYRSV